VDGGGVRGREKGVYDSISLRLYGRRVLIKRMKETFASSFREPLLVELVFSGDASSTFVYFYVYLPLYQVQNSNPIPRHCFLVRFLEADIPCHETRYAGKGKFCPLPPFPRTEFYENWR